MGFDKICRGSLIGEAHNKGLYVAPERSRARRGTHVSSRSYKLETTAMPQTAREIEPTQTYKTHNWFRHDTAGEDHHDDVRISKDLFSPRYWRQAGSLGPAPAPRRTEFRNKHKEDAHGDACYTFKRIADENKQSEGRLLTQEDNSRSNPTFNNSVDWMAYSSPREKLVWAKSAKEKWRHEFLKQKRSTMTLNEDHEFHPPTAVLTNSVNNVPSKGKKSFPSRQSECARLLQQDPSQPQERRSERRHQFSYAPEPRTSRTEVSLPTNYEVGQGMAGALVSQDNVQTAQQDSHQHDDDLASNNQNMSAVDADVRPGHRTSVEVRDAMAWGNRKIEQLPNSTTKFLVGSELRQSGCGKRASRVCLDHSKSNMINIAAAGASPREIRDHRNSDVLRAHLSVPNLDYNKDFSKGGMAAVMNHTLNQNHNQSISFPSGSGIPSGLSKNFSYLQSFQVQPYRNRGFGIFSPLQILNTPILG